jgi:hypothetical protein
MLPTRASRLCHELCVCVYVFGRRQIVHKIRPRILALRYNKRAQADIEIIYTLFFGLQQTGRDKD